MAVYAPVAGLQNLERKMFLPMAFTVCAAVLVSLLLALTYVPAGASYLFAQPADEPPETEANVRARDLGGFAADVERAVRSRLPLPPGYYVTYGGQFESQQRATRRLAVIIPAALLLIAGLLYASFGVLRHALVVMLNVPFALVGGIGELWLRGLHLNLSAAVGMIAVFGSCRQSSRGSRNANRPGGREGFSDLRPAGAHRPGTDGPDDLVKDAVDQVPRSGRAVRSGR